MTTTQADIAQRIKQLRAKLGMSGQQLADATGLAQSTVSKYENGEREPSTQFIVELARLTGKSTDWILLGERARSPVVLEFLRVVERFLEDVTDRYGVERGDERRGGAHLPSDIAQKLEQYERIQKMIRGEGDDEDGPPPPLSEGAKLPKRPRGGPSPTGADADAPVHPADLSAEIDRDRQQHAGPDPEAGDSRRRGKRGGPRT